MSDLQTREQMLLEEARLREAAEPEGATGTPGRTLALLPSLAVLTQEYRPSMDGEVLHSWASEMLAAIVVEKARHLLKQRYPTIEDERLVEIEDEDQLSWKMCLKGAVEALPLNNFAAENLPAPLPELYALIHQKQGEALAEQPSSDVVS